MTLTGVLRQIGASKCGHCQKLYQDHSKKGFIKCLYTANWNLYQCMAKLEELQAILKEKESVSVEEKPNE